jgi:hypothetical protein
LFLLSWFGLEVVCSSISRYDSVTTIICSNKSIRVKNVLKYRAVSTLMTVGFALHYSTEIAVRELIWFFKFGLNVCLGFARFNHCFYFCVQFFEGGEIRRKSTAMVVFC